MFEVVKGWGVWLETVEITDVLIASGTLFKDMQAEYREGMKKESELYKMVIQGEIDEQKTKDELIMQKKRNDAKIERNVYTKKIDEEIAEQAEKQLSEMQTLNAERAKLQNEFQKWKMSVQAENDKKILALNQEYEKLINDAEIQKADTNEEATKVERENDKLNIERDLEIKDLHAKQDLKEQQAMIALIKAQMDEKLMTLEAIEAAKSCYSTRYVKEMRMTSYGPNDHGAEILQNLVQQHANAKRNTGN
jgi:flotillin